MTTRKGRRARQKRQKRQARIGPDFGTGVRFKDFSTITEMMMTYDERDNMSAFQRWHFAKFAHWPSVVRPLVIAKIEGRSNDFDRLPWHTLRDANAPPEPTPDTLVDPLLRAFLDLMASEMDWPTRRKVSK